jgi:hypothetical protein
MNSRDQQLLEEAYKLVREFNAPEEANAILTQPDRPSGTLPHSIEAVQQELAFWGQHDKHRVMDPKIQALIDKLTELLKSQRTQRSSKGDAASVFKRQGVPRTPGMR